MKKALDKEKVMLIDIQYVRPNRKTGQADYLYYIYKDLETGEKFMRMITEPKITIYYEKPEFRDHNRPIKYIEIDKCNPKTIKYKDVLYDIANEIGPSGKEFLHQCYETGNYKAINELYLYPYCFGADIDVRMWYMYQWKKSLNNDKPKSLTKGFMDIEVDSYESIGLPDPKFNPVDLVTLIDSSTKQSYTFLLVGVECVKKDLALLNEEQQKKEIERRFMYEERLKQQEYWVKHPDLLKQEAIKTFSENYPGMEYNFYFYKDERKLLTHLWQLVNKLKLDMIGFWNIGFDIPYMIERLNTLGLNPTDIMCHPDFPSKQCYFKKDKKHFDIKNKKDYFYLSSYTVFRDQMVDYAALRKVNSELRAFRLNYIAQKELKDEKLDYSDNGSIKTISYHNYLKYVLYNIKDVLLQLGIEERTNDFDSVYSTSYNNITPYDDVFKTTKTLTGVQYESFINQGIIPRNNINAILNQGKDNDEESEEKDQVGFEGALVGNPLLIDYFGAKLYGKKSRCLFLYNIDSDMTAFYPSAIHTFNVSENALVFKCHVQADQFDVRGGNLKFNGITDVQMIKEKNTTKKKKDPFSGDIGKEVCDNLQTRNFISFGYKWLNLPSVNDVYELMKKRFS